MYSPRQLHVSKIMVISRMAKIEKKLMQLRLGLRSQCFTHMLYKYLYINFDILGQENGNICNIIFL